MGNLAGKVAVVTGAGNGIGRSEAITLAAHGAAVVVNDLDLDSTAAVVDAIQSEGGQAVGVAADVAQWASGSALVAQAVEAFGGLDIVVTNAGIVRRSAVVAVSEPDFDAQVGVLFKGSYGLLHHAARYWTAELESGRGQPRSVVITSSSAGVPGGVREFSVYGAMKAALAALTLGAALELRPAGITVNAILPHAATAMDAQAKGQQSAPEFAHEDMDPQNPQHVANVVAYLASERASWLSGQVLEITGTQLRRWVPWSVSGQVDSPEQWTPDALDAALATDVFGTLPGGRTIERAAG